jgi:acyl dehydratase
MEGRIPAPPDLALTWSILAVFFRKSILHFVGYPIRKETLDMLKQQTYEALVVGETFGPVQFRIDDHFVKGFAFAVDDFSSLYFRGPGLCGPISHSSAIAKKLLHIFMEGYDPQGIKSVHLKEDITYHAPVPFGEEITLRGRFSDVIVRRGHPCFVLESEARDASGRLLVSQRSVESVPTLVQLSDTEPKTFDGLSRRRVEGQWPKDGPQAESVSTLKSPGTRLPVITKTIHQDQMSMFVGANENWRNIHTDPVLAREAGFDKTIMSGMIQACWFSEMMVSFFGESFLTTGKLGMSFLSPVKAGETISCHAVAQSTIPDGAVELEFWSRDESGRMSAAGWATGLRA